MAHKVFVIQEITVNTKSADSYDDKRDYVGIVLQNYVNAGGKNAKRYVDFVVEQFAIYDTKADNVEAHHLIFSNERQYETFKQLFAEWESYAATKGITYNTVVEKKIPVEIMATPATDTPEEGNVVVLSRYNKYIFEFTHAFLNEKGWSLKTA